MIDRFESLIKLTIMFFRFRSLWHVSDERSLILVHSAVLPSAPDYMPWCGEYQNEGNPLRPYRAHNSLVL